MTEKTIDTLKIGIGINAQKITLTITAEEASEILSVLFVTEKEKGEWILVVDSYYEDGTIKENHWECSKCGSGKSGWGEYKFCPNCGADMRGTDE